MNDDDLTPAISQRLRAAYRDTIPPADAEERLMSRMWVEREAGGGMPRRMPTSLGSARWIRVVGWASAGAVLFVAGIGIGRTSVSPGTPSAAPSVAEPSATLAAASPAKSTLSGGTRQVQFVLSAPRASRVTLVGDFNGWDAASTPMRRAEGTGMWTVTLTLPAGRHVYAFVVDDAQWTADPLAPRAASDEFGTPSSVLVVGRSS